MKNISIVIPVYNEEGNVAALHEEIVEVCEKEGYNYEVIFVDDGSSDRTSDVLKTLKPLISIRMRRNFGQTAAMDAGIKASKYEYIVTMDGDRQNDPADIPKLIATLEEENLDVVSGWRKDRKDTFFKKFVSRGANLLRRIIVKNYLHDSGCSLKLYKRECFHSINLYGEMHRFIPALLETKGFVIGEVVVNHRPRTSGKTKYNWKRTIKGFVDMISLWFLSKYFVRPLHIFGGFGMIFLLLGFICGVWSVTIFALGYKMSDNIMPPLLTVLFLIMGLMMFVFGLITDMLSKTYYGTGVDQPYSIKEIVRNDEVDI